MKKEELKKKVIYIINYVVNNTKKNASIFFIYVKKIRKKKWEVIAIIEFIFLILFTPMPFFNYHPLWEDFFRGNVNSIGIRYLGDNTGEISFQVTNNNPHKIDDVKMIAELNCGSRNESFFIPLNSKITTIPPETSDIFYINDKELLSSINAPSGSDLEYKENVDNYPVYMVAKNKNVYILNHNGKITKDSLNRKEKIIFYEISCSLISKLHYSYFRFGKQKNYTKIVKELTIATLDKNKGYAWKEGPFSVMEGGGGEYLDDTCKKFCKNCSKYPDWNEALGKKTVGNGHLCRLWLCNEIKKQYPYDTISCLVELSSVCLWHKVKANENLSICSDIDKKLKTECMWYENDECHMHE